MTRCTTPLAIGASHASSLKDRPKIEAWLAFEMLRNGRLSQPDELMELGVLAHERASAALLVRSLRW